jgi:hypothetical protein
MTAQKRGLGRGLEALLVDVSNKDPSPTAVPDQAIHAENANLLKEAEALEALIKDFEILVSNLNIEK